MIHCGEEMAAFPVCDIPAGVVLGPHQRWVQVSAVIHRCRQCGHQEEVKVQR